MTSIDLLGNAEYLRVRIPDIKSCIDQLAVSLSLCVTSDYRSMLSGFNKKSKTLITSTPFSL